MTDKEYWLNKSKRMLQVLIDHKKDSKAKIKAFEWVSAKVGKSVSELKELSVKDLKMACYHIRPYYFKLHENSVQKKRTKTA